MYRDHVYPSDYGIGCEQHDLSLPPFCNNSTDDQAKPEWCSQTFCYIDKDNCNLPFKYLSGYFPVSGLYYSYQTCGADGVFNVWFGNSSSGTHVLKDLVVVVEDYVSSLRNNLQVDYLELADATIQCDIDGSCPCESCDPVSAWKSDVDFTKGVLVPTNEYSNSAKSPRTSCLAKTATDYFTRVAASEYRDSSNVGYLYGATHADGAFFQWPSQEFCPGSYNPKFRPWYSAATTGPKMVMLVIDCSGSMVKNNRIQLARDAAKAVLLTLTWRDQVGIVLFNSKIFKESDVMYVTDENRDDLDYWIDRFVQSGGATNFYDPITGAVNKIKSATDSNRGCSKVILFLTDGDAPVNEQEYSSIQSDAAANDIVIFTYALGNGADTAATKRFACDNNGVYHYIADQGDLEGAMSSYYLYFAAALQSSSARWVLYKDASVDVELLAACTPFDDLSDPGSEIRLIAGVVCMDMNVLVGMDELRANAGWDDLYAEIVAKTDDYYPLWDGYTEDTKQSAIEFIRLQSVVYGADVCGYVSVGDDTVDSIESDDNEGWNSADTFILLGSIGGALFLIFLCSLSVYMHVPQRSDAVPSNIRDVPSDIDNSGHSNCQNDLPPASAPSESSIYASPAPFTPSPAPSYEYPAVKRDQSSAYQPVQTLQEEQGQVIQMVVAEVVK